ncbi:anaphase-promoting complex subunit 2 [Trichonephila inaurata madagascariensis]|uniref:Anaphase-promoting complex subunit 2 n=1 Tax=Trichonephila inaurata madagascariensis TaxID=2747483 RepID=A0A8X6KMR4_9ARAC|nr:anaphase-promoting complex subunit 2 [Trichonephila inaurata madagascariensis]
MELFRAWEIITKTIKRQEIELLSLTPTREVFSSAVSVLHQHGMSHIVKEWFLTLFQEDMYDVIIPEFWNCFQTCEEGIFWRFPYALNYLSNKFQIYLPAVEELQLLQDRLNEQIDTLPPDGQKSLRNSKTSLKEEFFSLARCLLFAKWPVDFRAVLVEFFSMSFKSYQAKFQTSKETESIIQCNFCDNSMDACCCEKRLTTFYHTIQKLYELQFFQTVVGDVPINVAQDEVETYVHDYCKGNFEVPLLEDLRSWLEKTVIAWLSSFYYEETNANSPKIVSEYKARLMNILYEAFADVRMDQLFDIIIEFPESQAALEDLKEVLAMTNLRPKLISSLKTSLENRLLHPGVNTSDILTAYISAIKALRVLDRTGVVLQIVSEPVCKYLRSREDTVRCIIFSLREDSCGELACELLKGVSVKFEDPFTNDEEGDNWEKWSPDPVDADPAKTTDSQRSSDIIGILVNIYGSKELFVNEYRSLLADRILTTFSYNTDKELRYLEMLKLRFGESQLHCCEVMLKDIADSKRINSTLNSGEVKTYEQGDFPINSMILSAQFWPSFKEEKLKLPEYIWQNLKKYTTAFEALKGNRSLTWKSHLGSVDLEIELKGRILNLSVSPVHATILWHFQEKSKWSITELSSEMQIQPSVLRRKITLWQNHGVLSETESDVFELIEEQQTVNREAMVIIEEEEESVTASSQDMKEEELQTFWSFIVGMLTNMESLPLERIHSMLRMFAVQGTSTNECSIHDMRQFLEKKVRDRQLVYTAGMFKLPKYET